MTTLDPEIPLDVVYHIVPHCDNGTLCSLRLTCQSLLPVSSYHLFKTVNINASLLVDQYEEIGSTLPSIIQYVRHLSFDLYMLRFTRSNNIEKDLYNNMHLLFVQLQGRLNITKELSISFPFIGDRSAALQRSPFNFPHLILSTISTFRGILELNVRFRSGPMEEVLWFICSFYQLEVLRVEVTDLDITETNSIPACTLPESLKVFDFRGYHERRVPINPERSFLKWWSTHPARPTISHFTLLSSLLQDLNVFSGLFLKTLKSLYLGSVSDKHNNDPGHYLKFNLSNLNSLEALTIDMPRSINLVIERQARALALQAGQRPPIPISMHLALVGNILKLLKTIPSETQLHKLSFVVHRAEFPPLSEDRVPYSSDALKAPDAVGGLVSEAWIKLDEFLCSHERVQVVEVVVIIPDKECHSREEELLRERVAIEKARRRFGECDKLGKLLVSFSLSLPEQKALEFFLK
ncbi:hypothetical protein L218DRAFT_966357 [Marasmius fiardii PR-910]|nr:hypothetical protein L218DRAFT_966357 [Marasmius fiardii PR-910]